MQYTREFVSGTKGPDVQAFQSNLLKLGYSLPKYGADGVYGAETEAAAKQCAKDNFWDHCSWGPCPVWLQQRVEEKALQTPKPDVWLPKGRGMFVQSMNGLELASAEKIVEAAELKFLIVQAHWQYPSKTSSTYNSTVKYAGTAQSYGCTAKADAIIDRLLEKGIVILPFSYPVPTKSPDEVVAVLKGFANEWDSPSVVIDPEAEWKSSSGAYKDEALKLSAKMNEAFKSWGMTTYGAPWFHRSFPFAEFKSAAYGIPQTYGVTTFGTDEGMKRAHDEWRGYGFPYLVGAYGTYEKNDAEMRQLLSVVAKQNPVATIGWKWESTSDSEWEHIDTYLPR